MKKNTTKWLDWAVQIEDESDCDIGAGVGSVFSEDATYGIDRSQLIVLLQKHLSSLLSQKTREELANNTEQDAKSRIKKEVLMLVS